MYRWFVNQVNRFWNWIEYDSCDPTWLDGVKTILRFVTCPLYIAWVIVTEFIFTKPKQDNVPYVARKVQAPLTPYERTFASQDNAWFDAALKR
jgi:hypothetical protein